MCPSDSSILFGIPLINVSTCSIFQMNTYLGFNGFLLNSPSSSYKLLDACPVADYLPCYGKTDLSINRRVFKFFLKQLC